MADAPRCPDCRKDMDAGFIPWESESRTLATSWFPGAAKKQKFLGLMDVGVKLDRKGALEIAAYRCPHCGLVRMYAKK